MNTINNRVIIVKSVIVSWGTCSLDEIKVERVLSILWLKICKGYGQQKLDSYSSSLGVTYALLKVIKNIADWLMQ